MEFIGPFAKFTSEIGAYREDIETWVKDPEDTSIWIDVSEITQFYASKVNPGETLVRFRNDEDIVVRESINQVEEVVRKYHRTFGAFEITTGKN